MQIVLPDERPPSWNDIYAGINVAARARMARGIHWLVRAYIPPDTEPFDEPVHITVTAYFDKRPKDPDNIPAKIYIDGLIGPVLHNDTPKHVHSVTTRSRVDRDAPRVVIDLEVVK